MKIVKIIFGFLLFAGIFLPFFISADSELLNKDQVKNYLSIPENDNQQIMHTLIQLLTNELTDAIGSADRSPREDGIITTLTQSIKINALKFLLLDAPVEVIQKVVITSVRIAKTAYGITDLGDVIGIIEKESVKNAVQYGLNALLRNDIRVTSGALEINFISYKNNQQNVIFQYVITLKPNSDKTTGVAIAILSKDFFEPPLSTYGTPWRFNDWLAEGHTKIEPFIISVQGQMQKGDFNQYYWQGAPSISIEFPDNVPDLGFRPLSFWQRHLWKPIESQIREATVLLDKFLPSASGIVDGIKNIGQKIYQVGSAIKNTSTNLFGKINNYFQGVDTGASIAGFVYQNPSTPNLSNISSSNTITPPEQLTIIVESPTPTETVSQYEAAAVEPPDQLSIIQAQLNALIEQIDNIAEEADVLFASQNQTANKNNAREDDLAVSNAPQQSATLTMTPSEPQPNSSTPTATSTNPQNTTLANQLTSNQTTIVPPPPPVQILISEIKTESQNSAKDEYIELYNPNNFAVNLGGFILRKKTSGSASESVLVSSNKFQGNIAAFGYFLITPQSTTTGNLQYSSAGYYIAQTNSILLYDRYERLLDKTEDVIHPVTHSFGRKLSGSANLEVKYQNTGSSVADFEIQAPTPSVDNQRDTEAPQIILTIKPATTTSATSAAFTFSASKPGCSFEYQLDNNPWQKSDSDPVTANFKDLNIGLYNFQIRAQDPVGNWANPLQYTWEIIATPIQPAAPEPKILISEVQIESATNTKDEFIELFNPNNFSVDLNGFGLKKKTFSGAESNLVSPSHFTGIIAALGYFLITPQGDNTGNINYSGETYSIAQNNTILLYSNNDNLIDKVGFGSAQDFETAPAPNPPKGYSLGRKWADDTQSYQDTDNNQDDFEIQTPTPGAKNEKDVTAPQIEITSRPLTLTNQNQAGFIFSSQELTTTFFCKLDAGDWQECVSPKTYNNLSDGSHTFDLKASDPVDNFCDPIQNAWTVDTTITSPSLILSDTETHSTSLTNKQTAQASISQDQDVVAWFLSENPEKPTAEDAGWLTNKPLNFNLSINDGVKTIYVWTKDIAGNISQLGNSASIILDTTPPETTIEQSPATSTIETQAAFIFSSNETGISFFCKLDVADWQNCASSTVFSGLNEGAHPLEVKAIDLALNTDQSPAQYNWLIEPPTPELSRAILEISAADSTSTTPTALFFSTTQEAGNPPSKYLTIKNSGQSQMAWNISSITNWDWVLLATTSGTLLANASTTVEIAIDISKLDPDNYQATTTITADDAENSPQNVQINLKIEELPNEPPISAFSYSPSENLLVGDEITFNASSSTDPDGEITTFIWDFGDGSTTTTQSPLISHIFNTAGQFQILLTVQDDQGATSSPVSTILTIVVRPASRLLITEIQIRDTSSTDNDFIEIFNPTDQNIDISNFHLRKRANTGSESSVCEFPASSTVPAISYFLWANANYQMPDNLSPDITRASNIAANNSVALLDKDHNIIDQVAWGSGANPFVEITPFPQNPADNQTLTRQQDGSGNYIDTNNNSVDFVLASSTPTNSQGQTPSASSGQATSTSTPATSTPATSTPATSTPTFDPSLPVITDLEAAAAADRNAVDLWWGYTGASEYLIIYNNQTIHFTASDIQNIITATVENLTGGVSATFTVQYIDSNGATSGPSNIATATPLLSFQDNNDGTINDLYSGLMWPKDGSGLAANNGQPLTWFEAKDFCEQLVMCGNGEFATTTDATSTCSDKGGVEYDDWRLPGIKELASIIKYQKNPADGVMVDTNYFQNIAAGKYWSASFKHYNDERWNLWYVLWLDLGNGFIHAGETIETTSSEVGYFLPVRGESPVISTSGFSEPQTGCSLGYQRDDSTMIMTDLCTGLMWTGSFAGPPTHWVNSVKEAQSAAIGGYNNWRLPNTRELLALLNNPFQSGISPHWAITPDYQQTDKKWLVELGAQIGKTYTQGEFILNYFRFVRNP